MDLNFDELLESVSKVHLDASKEKLDEGKAPDSTDNEEQIQKKLHEEEQVEESSAEEIDEEVVDESEVSETEKVEEMEEEHEDPRVKNAMLVIMGRADGVKEEQIRSVLKAMADAQDDELIMSAVNSFRNAEPEMEEPEPEPEMDVEMEEPEPMEEEPAEEEEMEEGKELPDDDMEEGCLKDK